MGDERVAGVHAQDEYPDRIHPDGLYWHVQVYTPITPNAMADPIVASLAEEELLRIAKDEVLKFVELAKELKVDTDTCTKAAIRLGILRHSTDAWNAAKAVRVVLAEWGPSSGYGRQCFVEGVAWNWGPYRNEIQKVLSIVSGYQVSLVPGVSPDHDGPVDYRPSVSLTSKLEDHTEHHAFLRRVLEAKRADLKRLAGQIEHVSKRTRAE